MNKSKYEDFVKPRLFEIIAWSRDGMAEKDMAKRCKVPYSCWKEYKKTHPELEKAIKDSREIFDIKIENAFYKRVLGYSFTEETKEARVNDKTGLSEMVVTKRVKKEIPPDVGALKFALTNRNKSKWADKQVVEHEGTVKLEEFFK
jgi:hypothetical protein